MAPRRLYSAWIDPISTDPGLLVDREDLVDGLVAYLDELRVTKKRDAHVLVSGARGVGKSILTKAALARFARAHEEHAVCVTVQCRGLKYRPFLTSVAKALVDAIRPRAEATKRAPLVRWLDQLNLLATSAEVTRQQVETVGARYGADASVGADLVVKLQSRFAWEGSRSLATTSQAKVTITDDLLHDAISATLARLADEPWFVVVFYDNMDQTSGNDQAADVETLFRQVLELRACVSIAHFRTEALVENVKRDATRIVDVPALSASDLVDVVMRRLEAAAEVVQAQFPAGTDWAAVRALASITGNPLVFLRWVQGVLLTQPWPPPAGWLSPTALEAVVRTSEPLTGADPELVHRLVRVVDACDHGRPDAVVRREHLVAGGASAVVQGSERLTDEEIDVLVRLDILLPKHKYDPRLGYKVAPVLDLLRPSVQRRLAAAGG